MRHLPAGAIRKPATHDELLRVVAGFSNELCDMIAGHAPEHRAREMKALTDRFGASMQLSDRQLKEVLEESVDELAQVASILKVNLKQSPFARQVRVWTGGVEVPASSRRSRRQMRYGADPARRCAARDRGRQRERRRRHCRIMPNRC